MKRKIRLSELVTKFGGQLIGADLKVSAVSSLNLAESEQISFLVNHRLKNAVRNSHAGAFIVGQDFEINLFPEKNFIVCQDPYLYFAKVSQYFYPPKPSSSIIHASAIIGDKVQIDATVEVGPHVSIGAYTKVGSNTRILAGSVIGERVKIGSNCVIHPNVTILERVSIGNNVVIHSGTVVGSDGFGYAWDGQHWEKIPQVGSVEIHNDVEIGANVSIDRGAIENTILHQGVKIDNLVQIAHNCEIGENTAIAAMVGMAGSTKIGKNCRIAGAVKFTGHLSVADNTLIAGATIVSRTIEKPGGQFAGSYPFQEYQKWKYNAVCLRHLKSMYQKLNCLEQQLQKKINKKE